VQTANAPVPTATPVVAECPVETPVETPVERPIEQPAEGHCEAAAEPQPKEATAPPEQPREIALSLARLGFGAGMSARLNQLGIRDTADLAAVEPARLREALGEISRLVDIDAWVAHARALTAGK
jgi:predicted flap endonuclease-1-like 5' DNA nuclease